MARKSKEIALYKGDELIFIGTIQECAAQRNVQPETIRYYLTDAYARKLAKRKRSRRPLTAIVLNDDDDGNENTGRDSDGIFN